VSLDITLENLIAYTHSSAELTPCTVQLQVTRIAYSVSQKSSPPKTCCDIFTFGDPV